MNYEEKISIEEDYIFVQIAGEVNYDITFNLWKNIAAACNEHNCYRILGTSDLQPMGIMHAYEHQKIFSANGFNAKYKAAWVEQNEQNFETVIFIENVAVNRGLLNAKVFSELSDARRWLLED
jgi:hypothetical protein